MSRRPLLSIASLTLLFAGCSQDGYVWQEPWAAGASEDEDDGDDDEPVEDEDDGNDDGNDDDNGDDGNADAGDDTDGADDGEDTGGLDGGEDGSSTTGPPESPYQGGWDIGTCQEMVTPGGNVIPDFNLVDQYGDTVRAYDFCHKAILVVGGSFW